MTGPIDEAAPGFMPPREPVGNQIVVLVAVADLGEATQRQIVAHLHLSEGTVKAALGALLSKPSAARRYISRRPGPRGAWVYQVEAAGEEWLARHGR